jgi:ABC-type polysaccharide/polyol phosphate transport system ATPase subunit
MNSLAVRVEALGKKYRIGAKPVQRDLRETAMHLLRAFGKTREERPNNGKETVIWALQDVSFELSCGEILGVIGRDRKSVV